MRETTRRADVSAPPPIGNAPLPTICIVAVRFNEVSQTFVRRHVRELNGGNTVLVGREQSAEGTYGRPFLPWPKPPAAPRRGLLARWLTPPAPADPGSFADDFTAFLRDHGVGLVLCEFGTIGVEFSALCRRAGVPMFCYFRGYDATMALRHRGYRQALTRMFAEVDGVVAVSAYLLGRLARRGYHHPNALVIPSGVDSDVFMPDAKDPDLILSVGRMVQKKAPLTTIRAFAKVAARHPTIRLEMIGDGWMLKRVRRLVQRLGLESRVILHGAQEHAFVAERMKRAAIYMQHSVTALNGDAEGAPSSIQEAMAAGCAIVSTRHAGIPEIVQDATSGLLVRERDLAGYTAALEKLLGDPALQQRLGQAARAFAVENLDYRRLYARLEAAMAEAIAARR